LVLGKLKRDLKIPYALHSNAFLEAENEIHELMQRNASGVGQKPETIRTRTRLIAVLAGLNVSKLAIDEWQLV
jgi:hypothetical protein